MKRQNTVQKISKVFLFYWILISIIIVGSVPKYLSNAILLCFGFYTLLIWVTLVIALSDKSKSKKPYSSK